MFRITVEAQTKSGPNSLLQKRLFRFVLPNGCTDCEMVNRQVEDLEERARMVPAIPHETPPETHGTPAAKKISAGH